MSRRKIHHYHIPDGNQTDKICKMLELLELNGIAPSFKQLAEITKTNQGTYFDYLQSLLETEFARREDLRLNRWAQQSRLQNNAATIHGFDFTRVKGVSKQQILELATCYFVEQGRNIVFLGDVGIGKTHLSIALAREAISRGYDTKCITLDQLIYLVERCDVAAIPRLLRSFVRPRLLVIDDIDFYDTGKNAGMFLFKLLRQRYDDNSSTIVSSNRSPSKWGELFDSKEKASTVIDRLLGRAEIITLEGESYRMKDRVDKAKLAIA